MNLILLVDDEAAVCAEFARTLVNLGFEVDVAQDVESGLSAAEAGQFDAILVEFNLRLKPHCGPPRAGNGLQLVRQLRAVDLHTPILLFTAMEGELYETASLKVGANDFILKTTSIPSFLSRLRAHIYRYQSLCPVIDQ